MEAARFLDGLALEHGQTRRASGPPPDLEWLHDKAHKECFIANSVTTDVKVVT